MFQIWQLAAARPGPFMIRVVAAEFKKKEPASARAETGSETRLLRRL